MPRYLILFEYSAGLSLFDCKGLNELAVTDKSVQKSFMEFNLFSQQVHLVAFKPFPSTEVALSTMNSITEGQVAEFLAEFLSEVLPSQMKKHKNDIVLGVAEKVLAGSITQQLDVKCQSDNIVRELVRAIRLHFDKFMDMITPEEIMLAQLGLAHGYSRAKVKFNQHGDDNMIISAVALLTGLEKDLNTFSMRLREWYSVHFPELSKLIEDHYLYALCVQAAGNRATMTEEALLPVAGAELTEKIMAAAKNTVGREINEVDLVRIMGMAVRVAGLANYKNELAEYLHLRMHNIAPNLTALAGERMGAQLIMASGSLTNLAKAPASTVQLLGSEKALFNALKKRKHTPKYGMIFNSGPVQAATPEYKGRTARSFANKLSIAARVDAFGDEFRSGYLGTLMKEMMDKKIKADKAGLALDPNLEAMEQAVAEARRYEQNEGAAEAINDDGMHDPTPAPVAVAAPAAETPRKRRKKHHRSHEEQTEEQTEQAQPEPVAVPEPAPAEGEETPRKRRKHRRHTEEAAE